MRLFSIRVLIAVACLLPIGFVAGLFWLSHYLRQDGAPLDYSLMDVRRGPVDASINGYTLMREFSDSYEVEFDELLDELMDQPSAEWDAAVMQEQVEHHRELLDIFSEAFKRPEFYFDQDERPETLVPEVGKLRRYFQLRVLEVRLSQLKGEGSRSLNVLLSLSDELDIYAQSRGGLISGLTGLACRGILYEQMSASLADSDMASSELIQSVSVFRNQATVASGFELTFKHEFHFAKYCVILMADDPYGTIQGIAELSDGPPLARSRVKEFVYDVGVRHVFDVNATVNEVFLAYAEIIAELSKPRKERQLPICEALGLDLEDAELDYFSGNLVGKILLRILFPSVEIIIEKMDVVQARHAAIQLSFALKAYHQDQGQLPEKLSDLVPGYIAEVPLDPFGGKPMRYSKERAVVYSVGTDYLDNGGSGLPFKYQLEDDKEYGDSAEADSIEPTFSLRFAMEN